MKFQPIITMMVLLVPFATSECFDDCGDAPTCADFSSSYEQENNVSLVITNPTRVIPARILKNGDYDYAQVLNLSFLFYEAQRVGKLPLNNRISWRSNAFLNDKSPLGTDITGGWLDAGDNVRFNFPMAWSAGIIAWSVDMFPNTYRSIHTYDTAISNLKWVGDYFIKCYYAQDEIVGQIRTGSTDHILWTRPENIYGRNDVYTLSPLRPGSDLTGSIAGFLALLAKITKSSDINYSNKALEFAKKYYIFSKKYHGLYSTSIPDAAGFYPSSSMYDDMAWGAICLFEVTGDMTYLNDAIVYINKHWSDEGTPWMNYDWDSHSWGAKILIAKYAPQVAVRAKTEVDAFVNTWLYSNHDGSSGPKYTPKGLAWYSKWGSLRHSANAAFLMMAHRHNNLHEDLSQQKNIVCFAHKQMRYMLGESGRSYVVGYGHNPPMRPHHRSSSCPKNPGTCDWTQFNSKNENPSVLYGALVGGPDINDKYIDDRTDYVGNEVATDYNAGFTGVLAALINQSPYSSCQKI